MDATFPCWIISVEPSIFHKPRNISSERRGIAAFPQYWIRGSAVRMFYRNPPHTRARPSKETQNEKATGHVSRVGSSGIAARRRRQKRSRAPAELRDRH